MSKSIAFIGVGNMGCPMAENLMKAGKSVKVFDVSKKMLEIARDKNLETIENLDDLITADVETVITMLPEGKHSKEVYLGENGIINKVSKDCLLIDCSTIDMKTSIEIGKKASELGINVFENQNLDKIADFTCRDKSEIHFLPFEISKQDIVEVIEKFEQQKIKI